MSIFGHAARTLAVLALASPLAAQAPSPLAGARHVDERYELYAPTPQDVERARPHVERALQGFRGAFGEAPRIAVVLFDRNPELAAFDDAPLAGRGLLTRRWLTERAMSGRTPDLVGATQLGVVLGAPPEGAGARAVAAIPGGGAGVGLRPGDVIRAVNGSAVAGLNDFLERFDALGVGAEVKLEVDRGGTATALSFAKPAGAALRRATAAPGERDPGQWGRTLTHEVAHTLLDAYVAARLGRSARESRVPSWLHEAVAQRVEFPDAESRAPRLEVARRSLGSHIPLAELFTMDHPMAGVLRAQSGTAAAGASPTRPAGITSIAVASGGTGRPGGGGFYPQALSVLEFLVARAGPEILPRLVLGLAGGQTVAQVLAEAKAPLPTDPAALEREWSAWASAGGAAR
jgi:hypothetical protein